MTATDELRRMLDERGVKWGATDTHRLLVTSWNDSSGHSWAFTEHRDGGFSKLTAYHLTPEQAVTATLGATDANPTQEESSETCHDVWDTELTGRLRFQCSECGGVSLEITPNFCPVCGRKVVDPTTNVIDAEVEQ